MLNQFRSSVVELDHGRMDYVCFGQGKRNLIVLPGLSDGMTTVRGKALFLAKPYRPYFNDYTVYMFSRERELTNGKTIEAMAADQAMALKKLGLNKVSLLGVSQGGMIALSLALQYPELVNQLILAVTSARSNPLIEARLSTWIRYAHINSHKQLMIDTAEHSYSPAYLAEYRRFYPLLGLIGKPKSYNRFLINAESILHFDCSAQLSSVACPTLIIGGELDDVVGVTESYFLHEQIPGSELYIYSGLGHALYEEAPDFYQRVFSFLR